MSMFLYTKNVSACGKQKQVVDLECLLKIITVFEGLENAGSPKIVQYSGDGILKFCKYFYASLCYLLVFIGSQ